MDNIKRTSADGYPENLHKLSKKCAKLTLYRDYAAQLLAFIGAPAIVCTLLYASQLLGALAYDVLPYAAFRVLSDVSAVAAILCGVPLIYGYFAFVIGALRGENVSLAMLFCAFADLQTYCRAFSLALALLWRAAATFALPMLLFYASQLYLYELLPLDLPPIDVFGFDLTYTLLLASFFAALFFAFAFFSRFVAAVPVVLLCKSKRVSHCFLIARVCAVGQLHTLFFACVRMLPLYIVSVFSCGLIFFIYAGPFALLYQLSAGLILYDREDRLHTQTALLLDGTSDNRNL